MIYLLNAIGLSPGGSCTVHIYTQTVHRTTQNKQYTEQHNNLGRVRAVPRLGELYRGICLTTEVFIYNCLLKDREISSLLNLREILYRYSGFGGLGMSVLAFSTQVRGFKPGRSRRILRAKKSSARLPSEGK